MFDHLTRLACDRSPVRRAELLSSITDLFVSAGHHVDAGICELYSDIVTTLLPRIPYCEQGEFVDRLADMPTAPRELVLWLAQGEIERAEPMLRYSPALDDADLVELAASLPREHRLCLASRQPLAEAVTDILIAHGDSLLSRVVTSNSQARISPAGLARLVRDASSDAALGESLARRCRDGEESAVVLPFPAPSHPVVPADISHGQSAVVLRLPNRASVARETRITEESSRPVASVIAAVASDQRMLEVAILLAEHAGLPPDLVTRLIARPDPTLLAVLCKAAGVSSETFELIVGIRADRFGLLPEEVDDAMAIYDALSAADVEQTLRNVRDRESSRLGMPATAT